MPDESTTITFTALAVNQDALDLFFGRPSEPEVSVQFDAAVPLPFPRYVAPTGWRKLVPGAKRRARLDQGARIEAWHATGGMGTMRTLIPRARITS